MNNTKNIGKNEPPLQFQSRLDSLTYLYGEVGYIIVGDITRKTAEDILDIIWKVIKKMKPKDQNEAWACVANKLLNLKEWKKGKNDT